MAIAEEEKQAVTKEEFIKWTFFDDKSPNFMLQTFLVPKEEFECTTLVEDKRTVKVSTDHFFAVLFSYRSDKKLPKVVKFTKHCN